MSEGQSFSFAPGGKSVGDSFYSEPGLNGAGEMLRNGEITRCQPLPWGSNYVFIISLAKNGQSARAVYKPRSGEAPLWDFPEGTLYQREYAAYLVSRTLNWHMIPPTIIREGPHGVGMLQWFVNARQMVEYGQLFENHIDEFRRIALFDWLTNNADRKVGHCLEDQDRRLWFIDHGLTFNVVPKLRTVVWEFSEQPVPDNLLSDLKMLGRQLSDRSVLTAELAGLLAPEEILALKERLVMILSNPVFPSSFGSRRRYPWPPY